MRLVDAVWDTRNLGLTTEELIIEPSDQTEDVRAQLDLMTGQYQVIRVTEPSANISRLLAEKKFIFSEHLSFWECTLGNLPPNSFSGRLPIVETYPAKNDDVNLVFHQINSGLFSTDRISKDPDFGAEVAGKRYVNWLQDEIQRGANIYIVKFRQKPSGFFCLRVTDGNPFVALSGIFPETQIPGIGLSLQYEIQKKAFDEGCSKLTTVVSTNNVSAVRAHIASGFLWKGSETIFTRKS